MAEARKQRIRPSELASLLSTVTVDNGGVQPYRSLTLLALLEIRGRTHVRFALGHRYCPILVELRWPKGHRALDPQQRELLARGLRVLARDAGRSLRELYFFDSLPLS